MNCRILYNRSLRQTATPAPSAGIKILLQPNSNSVMKSLEVCTLQFRQTAKIPHIRPITRVAVIIKIDSLAETASNRESRSESELAKLRERNILRCFCQMFFKFFNYGF